MSSNQARRRIGDIAIGRVAQLVIRSYAEIILLRPRQALERGSCSSSRYGGDLAERPAIGGALDFESALVDGSNGPGQVDLTCGDGRRCQTGRRRRQSRKRDGHIGGGRSP